MGQGKRVQSKGKRTGLGSDSITWVRGRVRLGLIAGLGDRNKSDDLVKLCNGS